MQDNQLEPAKKQALKLLNYFERLVKEEGASWKVGRDLARRWVSVINGSLDLAEVDEIYSTLESEINVQGSAWYELFLEVKRCREWILSRRDD